VRSNAPVTGLDYGELWEWERFDCSRLLEIMGGFGAPWWIAGGWALDLWMGSESRPHRDVDVAILRDDQKKLHENFDGWELYYATPDHRLLPYRPNLWLVPPLHGVWIRPAAEAPWLCEVLLNEHERAHWAYRGNPAIRKPLSDVGMVAPGGVPILAPEVVLLYKAHELTEKDEADFQVALPHLSPSTKTWLLQALEESSPTHPWAVQLRDEALPH
jgi:hypothetical protein